MNNWMNAGIIGFLWILTRLALCLILAMMELAMESSVNNTTDDVIIEEFMCRLAQVSDIRALQALGSEYVGAAGRITVMLKGLASASIEEKKSIGPKLNLIKSAINNAISAKTSAIEEAEVEKRLEEEAIDCTMPARFDHVGSIHPISFVIEEATDILCDLGFRVVYGPEIEDDYHNFGALNTPEHHPARQMQSTFYLENDLVLRTQTSNTQIRAMALQKPPLSIISPGRVFRRDMDATHTPMFHQIEGLYVRDEVSLSDLRSCLEVFIKRFFGTEELLFKFRPSYFPFTEPSLEVDIKMSADSDWLEILGCGMVHPNVLRNAGIDPSQYSGFAFGIGIERLAMLKYNVGDIRNFFDINLQWLRHNSFAPTHY